MIYAIFDMQPRHRSKLYEAFFEGVVLYLVILYFYKRKLVPGNLTAIFLFFYGIFRFFIEFVRVPDADIGYLWDDWFTMGQLLSIPMIIVGILIFIVYRETTLLDSILNYLSVFFLMSLNVRIELVLVENPFLDIKCVLIF